MSENIFQIWDRIGRKTPFAVRRDNWSEPHYTIVEDIECEDLPYGKAYGYATVNGVFSMHYEYDGKWRRDNIIPCCGCYQWTLAENVNCVLYAEKPFPDDGQNKAVKTIRSRFFFGKHKGEAVADVFIANPSYIDWALINIEKFMLTQESFDYLDKINANFKFSEQARISNKEKLLNEGGGK